ncbi:PREDICTED: uncharacterized protein LOC106103694 [Papilio polytes]|uniref:uncharacterized protein LOC106103694 n=1 Tax=Papilio polytes TaxID=76194 RepID=UPI0006767514|nr:PREDICTED: uncharacterized protein LOC106103694 [Papilio polytes]
MDSNNLASGDTNESSTHASPRTSGEETHISAIEEMNNKQMSRNEISPKDIDDNETNLKERIAQCRSLIESLKHELSEEKSKLENESKTAQPDITRINPSTSDDDKLNTNRYREKINSRKGAVLELNSYAAMDSRLNCDENLIEYEKQLQRYQNTLNMAQIEKKNAIRKQMLSKAFNLKLLEVENQCNIELLRVKQSLQCLKPLQMIANKWKTNTDETYDLNNYELIPRYPEINSDAFTDFNKTAALDIKITDDKFENNLERTD